MASEDEIEARRRAYDSTIDKLRKLWYLAGSGVERQHAEAYLALAHVNNQTDAPHIMVPKRKYRKNFQYKKNIIRG